MTESSADRHMPLHVVHIISGLGHGGAETVLHRLATAPTQQDCHTVVSMGDDGVFGPQLQAAGITVHALNMKTPAGAVQGLFRMYRLLCQLRPDVVQTWMYHADLVGGLVARLAGIKAVAWGIRNSGADLHRSSRSARAIAWVCARLSGVIPTLVVSCAENAARRHQEWGYRADRMLVIPNGYDLSCWQPDPLARADVRAQWGWAQDVVAVGSVARWNPLKDHANLLAAFAESAGRDPSLRCVLIGHGMDEANHELMALIARHGLDGKVQLLGRRDDVPSLMNGLDIHVLSSRAEGFPNVVAEAMATGVACVVTDVGDAARIVGESGWVVPPQDAPRLSLAIDQAASLMGSAHMAQRLREGRERVSQLFSIEAMVDNYQVAWRRLALDYSPGRRLLFVINNPAFFLSHRLPLALGAAEAGFDVHVATMDGPSVPQITALGLAHHVIPMTRSGKHPLQEARSVYAIWRLFRRLRPMVVHAVTIKPVLYGGIAARLAGVPAYIAAISGLGFVFSRPDRRVDVLRLAATALYKLALGHPNSRVIFQNHNDRDVLHQAHVVRLDQTVLIRGSGVDLDEFPATPEPEGAPVAIMVARLLVDKGVREFVQAAKLSAGHPSGLRWILVGSPDPGNPASISDEEYASWCRDAAVECLGERSNIAELLAQSHIVVLPSYREGLPKSLVEAAACGRAVVTTDVPGCRDAIEPGVSGLLVPPKNVPALAHAVLRLADDPVMRVQMGEAGRRLAEQAFDVDKIAHAHVELYKELTGNKRVSAALSAPGTPR
jgi:glycosyltransferase involved in cell wall biosynthesis